MIHFLCEKSLNFMKDELVKHITAGSVIYKGTEDDQTITKEDLLKLTIDAIQTMKNIAGGDSEHFKKISNIPLEVSYEISRSLYICIYMITTQILPDNVVINT